MPNAVIDAIATHFPETIVTNSEIAERVQKWTAEEIATKTGIRERRFAAPEECASDLATKAAEKLIEQGDLDPKEVDYLIFCTQSPDYFLPTTACTIQDRLGLPRTCCAIDFNQGCSGYVIGLSLAKGVIASGQASRVLLLTGETYSKYMHPMDHSVCTLFGDGATATIIRARESQEGIGGFFFGTDGSGAKNLIVPAGAMRKPRNKETAKEYTDKDGNTRSENHLYMNGREVYRFALTEVPKTIKALLKKSNLSAEDIDFLILHQANRFMLDKIAERIDISEERIPHDFEDIGNTVSSTVPIVLQRLVERGRLRSGHRVMMIGFGVGYSWAGCIATWR